MHSKWFTPSNDDEFDPDLNSFAFVADNLNAKAHPNVLLWNGLQKKHQCFDSSMHSRSAAIRFGRGSDSLIRDAATSKYIDVTLEDVVRVSMNAGAVNKIKAHAKKQPGN
jgi:hypothetical protein